MMWVEIEGRMLNLGNIGAFYIDDTQTNFDETNLVISIGGNLLFFFESPQESYDKLYNALFTVGNREIVG